MGKTASLNLPSSHLVFAGHYDKNLRLTHPRKELILYSYIFLFTKLILWEGGRRFRHKFQSTLKNKTDWSIYIAEEEKARNPQNTNLYCELWISIGKLCLTSNARFNISHCTWPPEVFVLSRLLLCSFKNLYLLKSNLKKNLIIFHPDNSVNFGNSQVEMEFNGTYVKQV